VIKVNFLEYCFLSDFPVVVGIEGQVTTKQHIHYNA